MRLLCAFLLFAGSAQGVVGEPRSAKGCAGIEESFAYNDCIAKFGPKANQTMIRPDPGAVLSTAPTVAPSVPGRASAAAGQGRSAPTSRGTRVSGTIVQRRGNGRVFAEFRVGPSVPRAPVTVRPAVRARPGAKVAVRSPAPTLNSRAAAQRHFAGYGRRRYR